VLLFSRSVLLVGDLFDFVYSRLVFMSRFGELRCRDIAHVAGPGSRLTAAPLSSR
jgi:hypothetical protein